MLVRSNICRGILQNRPHTGRAWHGDSWKDGLTWPRKEKGCCHGFKERGSKICNMTGLLKLCRRKSFLSWERLCEAIPWPGECCKETGVPVVSGHLRHACL